MKKILISFGCRPEIIKFCSVIGGLKAYPIKTVIVNTGQQTHLSDSFIKQFHITPDYQLEVDRSNPSLNILVAQIASGVGAIIEKETPDLVLIQGDTTTAMASALAAFNLGVPVGHVEAGLRTYDKTNPFPEEINRQLISRMASYHFCPTEGNRQNLVKESTNSKVFVTGNPGIDVVKSIKPSIQKKNYRQVLMTVHRRETIQSDMLREYLWEMSMFLEENSDIVCKFITHPNTMLNDLHLVKNLRPLDPLPYDEFIQECYNSDVICSDSGGVAEEATIIKTPLIILRKTTESGEALCWPMVRLVSSKLGLYNELTTFFSGSKPTLTDKRLLKKEFGNGDSGKKIAKIISQILK